MGYVLLWIENLTVSLLFVALVLACAGRVRRRWLRLAIWAPALFSLMLGYAYLTIYVVILHIQSSFRAPLENWLLPLLVLTLSFILGALWLRVCGFRKCDEDAISTVAGTWPRGKLLVAFGVAVALHLMTFWNMDLAVRQQLETLRGEAGALSLSVAPPRVPDRDNAAILYERAFENRRRVISQEKFSDENWKQWIHPGQAALDVKNPDLHRYLRNQAATIDMVKRAAAKPVCYFENDYQWPTIFMVIPGVQGMDIVAGLLALDARVQAADGNMRAAMQDINSAFAISQHITVEPMTAALFVSSRLEQKITETLQQILASNSVSLDDLSIIQIDELPSHQTLLQRDLRFEEAMGLTVFYQFSKSELDIEQLTEGGAIVSPTAKHPVRNSIAAPFYRVFLFSDDLAEYRRLCGQLRDLTAKPYYKVMAEIKQLNRPRTGFSGLLTGAILPSAAFCAERAAKADALRQALRLGLAAEKYRLRHKQFPEKLDALAPDFIPSVPLDPFDGKPMRMKRTDKGLVIYSVGPDLTDDGGKPMDEQNQTGDITFTVPDGKP
jgi:hypothetical protein